MIMVLMSADSAVASNGEVICCRGGCVGSPPKSGTLDSGGWLVGGPPMSNLQGLPEAELEPYLKGLECL